MLKLKVSDYFSSVISQIDLKVEKIFCANKNINEQQYINLNKEREALIEQIRLCESLVIQRSEKALPDTAEIDRLDEPEQNRLIYVKFCFLIAQNELLLQHRGSAFAYNFGYLFVTDRFVSEKEISLFKESLKFIGNKRTHFIDRSNSFFDTNSKVKHI